MRDGGGQEEGNEGQNGQKRWGRGREKGGGGEGVGRLESGKERERGRERERERETDRQTDGLRNRQKGKKFEIDGDRHGSFSKTQYY